MVQCIGRGSSLYHQESQASLESSTGILYWMSANKQESGIMEDCMEHFMAWPRSHVPDLPMFHWLELVSLPPLNAQQAGK